MRNSFKFIEYAKLDASATLYEPILYMNEPPILYMNDKFQLPTKIEMYCSKPNSEQWNKWNYIRMIMFDFSWMIKFESDRIEACTCTVHIGDKRTKYFFFNSELRIDFYEFQKYSNKNWVRSDGRNHSDNSDVRRLSVSLTPLFWLFFKMPAAAAVMRKTLLSVRAKSSLPDLIQNPTWLFSHQKLSKIIRNPFRKTK